MLNKSEEGRRKTPQICWGDNTKKIKFGKYLYTETVCSFCGVRYLSNGDKRTKSCGCEHLRAAKKNLPPTPGGKDNPNWKGGLWKRGGYVFRNNQAAEHREIAQRIIGRKLRKLEVVHHINGKRDDNRNSNLLICSRAYHQWLHLRMSQLYQEEHFNGFNIGNSYRCGDRV